jgi:hypothetical protein
VNFLESLRILIGSAPALVKLLSELASYLKDAFGQNPAQVIDAHAQVFKQLREAKTPDEKTKAAAAISDLIRKL